MDLLWLAIAILLPWGAGIVCLLRWRESTVWPACLGYGFIVGILTITLLMRFVDLIGLPQNFYITALFLSAFTLLGLWLHRHRLALWSWNVPGLSVWREQAPWQKSLFCLFLILILIRFTGIAAEIWLRPLYPWDAWTTWAVKPRVWFADHNLTSFVAPTLWLNDTSTTQYALDAWHYPDTVPLFQLWIALAIGHWDESVNNILWLMCFVALALGFYGQARLSGVNPLISIIFLYLLSSIPILDVHIALAGYADLWLATVFGLASIAFFQWLHTGDRFHAWLGLCLALMCPTIKNEGTVWILAFIPALIASRIPLKHLVWIIGLVGLALFAWLWAGGFSIMLPGFGQLSLTPKLIQIPYLGRFEITPSANWEPFIQNFFVLANWHLFWYLTPALVLISLRKAATEKALFCLALLILSQLAMLAVLFFLTEAQEWAEKYTSINRLFLHVLPTLMFYALLLMRPSGIRSSDKAVSCDLQPG